MKESIKQYCINHVESILFGIIIVTIILAAALNENHATVIYKDIESVETTSPANVNALIKFTHDYETWCDCNTLTTYYKHTIETNNEVFIVNESVERDNYLLVNKPHYTLHYTGDYVCLSADEFSSGYESVSENSTACNDCINNNHIKQTVLSAAEHILQSAGNDYKLTDVTENGYFTAKLSTESTISPLIAPVMKSSDLAEYTVDITYYNDTLHITLTYTYPHAIDVQKEVYEYVISKDSIYAVPTPMCNYSVDTNPDITFDDVFITLE